MPNYITRHHNSLVESTYIDLPIIGYCEPNTKASRRIEVRRTPENTSIIVRWDYTPHGERILAWASEREPEWFVNNRRKKWTIVPA